MTDSKNDSPHPVSIPTPKKENRAESIKRRPMEKPQASITSRKTRFSRAKKLSSTILVHCSCSISAAAMTLPLEKHLEPIWEIGGDHQGQFRGR